MTPDEKRILYWRPIALFVAAFIGLNLFGAFGYLASLNTYVVLILSQVLVVLGIALAYRRFVATDAPGWPRLSPRGLSPLAIVLTILAAVTLGFFANLLGALIVEVVPGMREIAESYQQTVESLLLPDDAFSQVLGAVAVALIAPLCEEFLFRATILPELARTRRARNAIILNGLLFGAMHANPMAFVPLSIVGIFLAHITLSSGGVFLAILAHAALNTANGVVLPRIAHLAETAPEDAGLLSTLKALALVTPLAIFFWWSIHRELKRIAPASSSESSPVR
ncbi:CPBP family intramembrane metalloprotease [Lujinxingia vulgaris]|uniref:CPBP family intramembrane metalloprotease n=1 Tax=Lujinxingia vulgaris TaxID=2600176 RepID=A0A5C6X3J0_9DELT|nr:type II CAAX endopeptidase family protein [Lujinxingia vulgaris]TXD34115.1 CPBP family intramembrane metalloprotease [Lujinxingia vulgaris]